MRLADYLRADDVDLRRLMKQCGVDVAVLRLPEADAPQPRVDLDRLARIQREFAADGLTIEVIEPVPPMERVKQGLPGREQEMERLHALIRGMAELQIPVLCYNFMAVFGWLRSEWQVPARGGALVTGYDHTRHESLGPAPEGPIDEQQMWDSYAWFLDAALPVAEEAGVTLALHPDDPPVSPVRGIARILRSPEAFDRVLSMSDSPRHQVTFCQGTFATMGADIPETIRRFAARTAFVHFRDIRGTPERFVETFHDEGRTDMVAAMRTWVECGYTGPVRCDHVPTMHGETDDRPGYETLGRLYAVGYIRGLLDSATAAGASHSAKDS